MGIKNKKIIAAIGILSMLFLMGYWLYPSEKKGTEYIFDKSYKISLEDVKKARMPLPGTNVAQGFGSDTATESNNVQDASENQEKELSASDLKKIFSEGLINSHTTLKYFKHLEYLFRKSTTLGEHLEKVKNYLFSQFPETEAQQLYDTYKKYLECEMALMDEYKNLSSVKSMSAALETLKKIQDFRRARLGDELADKLFGADVKAKEYAFRRADIVSNKDLYGKEKEDQLKKLDEDMWGDESKDVEAFKPDTPAAWQRFNEKQEIYKKDLDEISSPEAREEKIKEYRTAFFSPEVVKRLDAVDQQIAGEKQNEAQYRDKEKTIMEDNSITDDQKNQKIKKLQDQMFGKGADAFRRRETMRTDLEKMMKEYPKK